MLRVKLHLRLFLWSVSSRVLRQPARRCFVNGVQEFEITHHSGQSMNVARLLKVAQAFIHIIDAKEVCIIVWLGVDVLHVI
jgi:hypothetical protein